MPRKADPKKLLPNCDGPKLNPFKESKAAIQYRRLLSDNDPNTSGGHAHVFDVTIGSVAYALKIFKFYDDEDHSESLSAASKKGFSSEDVRAHSDPFYRECRAYGKVIEANMNGKIAARCHGYMTILAMMENELRTNFHISDWDRSDEEYDKPVSERQPLRAIVKDLILSDVAFTKKNMFRMLKHLKQLRVLGIYPIDLAARNYRDGLLVDFSAAITEPYYLFTIQPHSVYKYKQEDLIKFDKMIKDAGFEYPQYRALPDKKYKDNLRNQEKTKYLSRRDDS